MGREVRAAKGRPEARPATTFPGMLIVLIGVPVFWAFRRTTVQPDNSPPKAT